MTATKKAPRQTDFRGMSLGELPGIGNGPLAGLLRLAGLSTIGHVLALAPDRLGVLDALIDRHFSLTDTNSVLAAIQGRYAELGLGASPWSQEGANGVGYRTDTDPDLVEELLIDVDTIVPSPLNPRKTFNQDKLLELAVSIRAKGVLQPILVRKEKKKCEGKLGKFGGVELTGRYELIFGERRWRAAKLADLEKIRARVVDFTDKEVLEVQVIENEQRDDVPPLEKAAGYDRLIKDFGYTVDSLAARIGTSTATIYGLLKLRNLPAAAKEALAKGLIPATTAQLIARIPSEKLRADATKRILKGNEELHAPGGGWMRVGPGPMSLREAKTFIEAKFTVELKKAPFDRKALDLVPSAGACTACPKLSGNNRKEFPDARADICTDPVCYQQKVEAHNARLLEDYAAKPGYKVLSTNAAARLESYEHHKLSEHCWEDTKRRTYKTLLKDALAAGKIEVKVRVDPRTQEIEEFVRRDQAKKHLRGKIARPSWDRRSSSSSHTKAAKKERERVSVFDELRIELMTRAMAAAQACFAPRPSTLGFTEKATELLRMVATNLLGDACDFDALVRRRNPELPDQELYTVKPGSLLANLDAAQVLAVLTEQVAAKQAPSRWRPQLDAGGKQFWVALGIDIAKVKAGVEKRVKARAESNGATNGKHPEPDGDDEE